MKGLKAIQIERFKAIKDAPFDLSSLNVLVGANNSGKSSLIQGLHFAISLLQTLKLTGNWTVKDNKISTSISPTQLIYSPSESVPNLVYGTKLLESLDSAIKFTLTLHSGERTIISMRKGRNRNILVGIENPIAAETLASLETPFSVFSPGLAGIAKTENWLSDGVLLRTIARGDANLVLRNILFRLWKTESWDKFLEDLHQIFPGLDFDIDFKRETDEFINVSAITSTEKIPLDLVGTGVLQAIQILSYVHRFSPSLVVLDEPDSHLHPNNQRLLSNLLRKVAEEREIQIILTTHSRHVIDSLATNGLTKFLWVRNGTIEPASADDEVGILLEIGALDIKERAGQPGTKNVILTEDENTKILQNIVSSSGFDMSKTVILPYYGITASKQLRPLIHVIGNVNPKAKIIVHGDRDYLSDEEAKKWESKIRKVNAEPFLTTGTDIESHVLNVEFLGALNKKLSIKKLGQLLEKVRKSMDADSVEHYVNGKIEIARRNGTQKDINHGKLAIEAQAAVKKDRPRWSHGKSVLKKLKSCYKAEAGENLKTDAVHDSLSSSILKTILKK